MSPLALQADDMYSEAADDVSMTGTNISINDGVPSFGIGEGTTCVSVVSGRNCAREDVEHAPNANLLLWLADDPEKHVAMCLRLLLHVHVKLKLCVVQSQRAQFQWSELIWRYRFYTLLLAETTIVSCCVQNQQIQNCACFVSAYSQDDSNFSSASLTKSEKKKVRLLNWSLLQNMSTKVN